MITINELILFNTLMAIFLIYSFWLLFKTKNRINEYSKHHLISHISIAVSILISVNLYVYLHYTTPLILCAIYILQHLTKENIRLVKQNYWSPGVKEF